MIITRIKANNVLKYETLDLQLPASGLIAISGPNESGKSSIGEAVCFALFGRTFSIAREEIEKVVRWGENHCAVTLDFTIDEQPYELSRFLDRDGNHSAKLVLAGEPDPVARGIAQVDEKLGEMLGFEYEQFVESFYLAQREITTPHPHSQAVKIMAGIAPMEHVVSDIEHEIRERRELMDEVQAECESVENEIDELGIEEGHLQALEHEKHDTVSQVERVQSTIDEMSTGLDTYCDNTSAAYKAMSARGRGKFFRFIFLMLALISGGVWALLTQGAHLPAAAELTKLLDVNLPQWQQIEIIWLAYAAAGFLVLFFYLWMRVSAKNRLIGRLHAEAGELATVLNAAREIDIDTSVDEEEEDAEVIDQEELDTDEAASQQADIPQRPELSDLQTLAPKIEVGEATARQVREYTEQELAWLKHVTELLSDEVKRLDDAVVGEQERLREAATLREVLAGMHDKRGEVLDRIELRNKSLELLNGAVSHLSNTFNRDIKELVARMLPLFTDNRYEHLQIDEDLTVRVFSNDKRDFMDLEEVSSGTQRQIMLALRLALSQKLLSRAVKGKQFAFLDEPFAFFDEERTRKAMVALSDLGEDIPQVWIVAQTFDENIEVDFEASLVCERDKNTLLLEA